MVVNRNQFEISYGSDLIIGDRVVLATCCVFYDRVVLPYTAHASSDLIVTIHGDSVTTVAAANVAPGLEGARAWDQAHHELFEAQVLTRLPEPDRPVPTISPSFFANDQLLTDVSAVVHTQFDDCDQGFPTVAVKYDLLRHLMREDIALPEMFHKRGTRVPRSLLVALEAEAVCSYLPPALHSLPTQEILRVRDRVKDTREGFSMHLQKLSKGLDERAKGGCELDELRWWANNIVETDVIPDYREFRRQLAGENAGRWAKALDATEKFFQIDAAPWTPKFWGQLMKALGTLVGNDAAVRKERLTNRAQALQFMSFIEQADWS